jgi:excisionase family DNA binding protein
METVMLEKSLTPAGEEDQTSTTQDKPSIQGGAFDRRGAAKYMSISTRRLDDLLTDGELLRLKSGRKTLVLRSDCDDYLARLAKEAT